MVKKEIKIEDKKEVKSLNACSRCGTEMKLTGGGPLGSKDYECPECHAKMTKGG